MNYRYVEIFNAHAHAVYHIEQAIDYLNTAAAVSLEDDDLAEVKKIVNHANLDAAQLQGQLVFMRHCFYDADKAATLNDAGIQAEEKKTIGF